MKKKWIVAFAAACAIALAGCKVVSEPEPIAVQSVTLNTGTLTLTIDDDWTRTLVATVYPYNADNRTVTWYSSNPEVADVDYWGGVVTAHSEGTTTISAYAGSRMASCEVTVKRKEVAVDSITLSADTLTLEVGKTEKLTATVMPDDADDKTVTWSSSDTSVATVGDDGTVTAFAEGTASITAKAGGKQATCLVTVKQKMVAVSYFTLDERSITLKPGARRILIATVYPDNADYKIVTWSSSNPEIATVENSGLSDGMITAISPGTAIITAQAGGNGYMLQCLVTVSETAVEQPDTPIAVTGVMLDKETLTLTRGEECTLTAMLTPNNADYTYIEWTCDSSPDWGVLDFILRDNPCTVAACGIGTATITATTREGGFKATCEVTVLPKPIESITFASSTLLLACGDKGKIGYDLMPIDLNYVDERTLIWSSSDETIATVDNTWGDVTAHKAGKATITATALAGGKTATYDVIVHEHSYSEGKCIECGANPTMDNGTIDENGVLTKYSGCETKVTIPEGVTGIGYKAFYNREFDKLTSVTIPDSVKSIDSQAFYNCTGLTSVTMGNGVTSIGDSAFATCTSLASVTIPNSVKSIGDSAFAGCKSLASVTIPNNVTSIGSSAFSNCTRLTDVTIPASVTSIGNGAFENCWGEMTIKFEGTLAQWNAIKGSDNMDITCITCSDGHIGVKDIPAYLKMKGRTVTGYLDSIPENIVIPEGVTSIGKNAFDSCTKLTSLEIPSSVTSIGYQAFYNCSNLTSVTIPGSVTEIKGGAFQYCTSLKTVNYRGTKKEWDSIEGINGSSLSGKIITGKNANGDKTQWLAQ